MIEIIVILVNTIFVYLAYKEGWKDAKEDSEFNNNVDKLVDYAEKGLRKKK